MTNFASEVKKGKRRTLSMSKKEKNVLIGDVNNLFQENTCEAVHLKLKLEM